MGSINDHDVQDLVENSSFGIVKQNHTVYAGLPSDLIAARGREATPEKVSTDIRQKNEVRENPKTPGQTLGCWAAVTHLLRREWRSGERLLRSRLLLELLCRWLEGGVGEGLHLLRLEGEGERDRGILAG